ncbi:A-kinase anchor 13-like [Brachionus plicatilis]|uniref:A-kinase anchor 13-like n=1 Tax=Brachionus plicatilis TaxID=10195 RepID=A0A3M7QUR4_BRAPC|nr:A-kinase anchor 13-like [Brachionus plicatilis]
MVCTLELEKFGNAIEENCHLFVFKNSICHVNHESINYKESVSTQANTNKSVLIGYCDIKYYKDRYITLSEFLIHSVYDTKSLATEIGKHFSPYEYLRNFAHSPLDRDIVDNSPFRNFYLNFFNNQTTCRDNLTLDENLVKSFRHIEIPNDWSLLGQNSASNKKLLRENLLHFAARHNLKKFCSILINLPGSFEGLECLNLNGELPCQLAIKKKHKKIALLISGLIARFHEENRFFSSNRVVIFHEPNSIFLFNKNWTPLILLFDQNESNYLIQCCVIDNLLYTP